MFTYYKTDRIGLSILASVAAAFIVGEIKELSDRNRGGKFSNDDLIITTLGGFTGAFTKIMQIGIQERNKEIHDEEMDKYNNLNQKPLLLN